MHKRRSALLRKQLVVEHLKFQQNGFFHSCLLRPPWPVIYILHHCTCLPHNLCVNLDIGVGQFASRSTYGFFSEPLVAVFNQNRFVIVRKNSNKLLVPACKEHCYFKYGSSGNTNDARCMDIYLQTCVFFNF